MYTRIRVSERRINSSAEVEFRDRLEEIAPDAIRKGGMTPITGLMLAEEGGKYGGIAGAAIGGSCFGPGGALLGHRIGTALGPLTALGLGFSIERFTGQELETTFGQLKSGIFGQGGRAVIKPGHTYPEGFTGIPKVLRNMPGGMSAAERELLIPFGGVTPMRPEGSMPFRLNMDKTSKEGKAEAGTSSGGGDLVKGKMGSGEKEGKDSIVLDEKRLQHTFRNKPKPGHLKDTPANRKLLERIANDPKCKLGPDEHGNTLHGYIQNDGTQVWVQLRDGKIINGGVNQVPKVYNPKTGLSASQPPKQK